MLEKDLIWVASSLDDVRNFPAEARRQAGHQLHLVQQGLQPHDFKPMPSVGTGVFEIRIHTSSEHRVFYVAKFREGVYVLHAFEKRTRNTARHDIELGAARFRQVVTDRLRPGGRSS